MRVTGAPIVCGSVTPEPKVPEILVKIKLLSKGLFVTGIEVIVPAVIVPDLIDDVLKEFKELVK